MHALRAVRTCDQADNSAIPVELFNNLSENICIQAASVTGKGGI